jgi:LacI family transcriptional regulator
MIAQHPPTISDVAAAAGVSISTVSLAQRQPARVKPETRDRIAAAVAKLGYVRNASASVLASRAVGVSGVARRSSIAYVKSVFRSPDGEELSDPLLQRIERESQRMGYGFELVRLDQTTRPAAIRSRMLARGVAGIVFGPVKETELVDAVDWAPFSLVRCNNDTAHIGAHRAESDVFEAAWRVTQTALKRGYQKIGLSLYRHARGFDDDVRRLGAFRSALADSPGRHAKSGPVFQHPGTWKKEAFLKWIREHSLDCVICFNVVEYYWLMDAGIQIPGDLALASLICAGDQGNVVAGCYEDFEQITVTAFQLCDQLIRSRDHGLLGSPRSINIPCLWHEGTTLPDKLNQA